MSKTEETSVIVHTTRGAMQAQTKAEKVFGDLKNFAVIYVSPISPNNYKVCFQYDT